MIPRTISASSLQTADGCLARFKAENMMFTPGPDEKVAANIGTACHGALEDYVQLVYIDKSHEPSWDLLEILYKRAYLKTFDTVDAKTPEYKDGLVMVKRWFDRTDLSNVQVISVETKTRIPIPTSAGPIPMTYIWDRCDFFEENGKRIIRVTDYKTIRAMLGPDDVRGKLQARIYDMAARIQFKDWNIDEFQIVFDLLRYDAVGVVYAREDAVDTWDGIIARAERILATDEERPPETLNADCGYCVRKLSCKALQKNIAGDGVFAHIDDIGKVAAQRDLLASQLKGIEAAVADLDNILIKHAEELDTLSYNEGDYNVKVVARKTRSVDSKAVAEILGPDYMAAHGKIKVSDIDEMLKAGDLTPESAARLKGAMSFSVSAPSVKLTPKKK